MKTQNTPISFIVLALIATFVTPLFVSAQTVAANAMISVTAVGVEATTSANTEAPSAARLLRVATRSDSEIAVRITALNALATRIQSLNNVSATEKAAISAQIQTNISGLTTLKAKIDADTDILVALTDEKSIFGSYRIYALVIPQGYIAASADRVDTIVGLIAAVGTKLQARITTDQSAGQTVTTLTTALSDMNAKTADATAQSTLAQTGIASLVPDQGNQTKLTANTAALKAARANIKTATTDLQTARQDINIILQGLKALEVRTPTATSTSAVASTTISASSTI